MMGRKFEIFLASLVMISVLSVSAVQIFYRTGVVVPTSQAGYENATDYRDSTIYRRGEEIALKVSHYPKSVLLINGEAVQPTAEKGDYRVYRVYEGDVVELDLRGVKDEEVSVYVAAVSDGVSFPKEGTKLFVKNGIRQLFCIQTGGED